MSYSRKFTVTAEDIAGANRNKEQGQFSDVACPGEHIATVTSIGDHIKKGATEPTSTVVGLEIATPSGPVPFRYWVPWAQSVRWRVTDFIAAFEGSVEPGVLELDERFIGLECGVSVDWQKDRDTGEPTNYREITEVFALVDEPIVDDASETLEEPEVL